MKLNKVFLSLALVGLVTTASITGCAPPKHTLNSEEKLADLFWLYSQFGEFYAPLEYKEQRFNFKYSALKLKYVQESANTNSNEEFYKLMYSFVSEFKDAHTSASIARPKLPGRAKIAYLGFTGKRLGDKLLVTNFLPTMNVSRSNYPIRTGDLITKLDGTPLKTLVLEDQIKYRNLGQDEANLTFHMSNLFTRFSVVNGQPEKDVAVITVLRSGKEVDVIVPWMVKDIYTFASEQRAASQANGTPEKKADQPFTQDKILLSLGLFNFNGDLSSIMNQAMQYVRKSPTFNWWNTFKFVDEDKDWFEALTSERRTLKAEDSPMQYLGYFRNIPADSIPIADAKTYPAYISEVKSVVVDSEGKPVTKSKFVGYIFLDSFSPGVDESVVVTEVQNTLKTMQKLKVSDVVVDMINNGGGSLVLGMRLAQLFSNERIMMPQIQYRLSEAWMDDFEQAAMFSASDAEKEIFGRVYKGMQEDQAQGKRLSRKFPVESLLAFPFNGNEKLESKLNVYLLVNEMCASMCDIFTAIMKDNNLATVVGAKTMGAGGNVVEHAQAPNSHLTVRQTESLILRSDGKTYLENNGVEPDLAMAVNEDIVSRYDNVRLRAVEHIMGTVISSPAPQSK